MALACGSEPEGPRGPPAAPPAAPRIVFLSSEVSLLLVDLGLGHAIVGAGTAADALPELGRGLDLEEPTRTGFEALADRVVALEPEFTFLIGTPRGLVIAEVLRERGVTPEVLQPRCLNDVVAAVHRLGRLLGRHDTARRLVGRMVRAISRIAVARDGRPRLTVAWVLDRDPLRVVGGSGLLHEMLELAGAENAYHRSSAERAVATSQQLAAREIDLILDSTGGSNFGVRVPDLRALPIDPELASLPTLDVVSRIEQLHALLYPPSDRD